MKHKFNTRKEVTEYLKTKDIDTSNWSEEKWLQINKGAADIHIMNLAEKMYDAYNESKPVQLKENDWHIPFSDNIDNGEVMRITPKSVAIHPEEDSSALEGMFYSDVFENIIKIATARCARISYETLGDNPVIDYEKDIKLHDDLLAMNHASPFEHIARVQSDGEFYNQEKVYLVNKLTDKIKKDQERDITKIVPVGGINGYNYRIVEYGWSRNFRGFQQYREIIETNK